MFLCCHGLDLLEAISRAMRDNNVQELSPLIISSESAKMGPNGLKSHQRLVFEDTEHRGKMLAHLNTMRKEGHFCDATLEIGGHNFPVHRAVLASCSVYMFELFSSKDEPPKQHFKLKEGFDHLSFEVLINYAYTGRLECEADFIKSVYRTASVLKIHKVAKHCSQFLAENLTPRTCLGVRAFASAYSDVHLTTKVNQYIEENLVTLPERSAEFLRLPSIVVDIVGVDCNALNSSSEKQLCQMVVDWIEKALDERPLERLTEDHQILYLEKDNSLRECLGELGDAGLDNSDIVCDYKKLGRRKQLQPVKGKRESDGNGIRLSRSPLLSSTENGSLEHLEKGHALWGMEKFGLVASKMVGDRTFMCVAVLNGALASISVKLRLRSDSDAKPESSTTSPIHENCSSPFESQCSLTPLAPMSLARCGLGTVVLDNRLIALGGYDRGDCLNSVEAFDLRSNVWSPMKPMHMARGRFAVVRLEDQLYACGGSNGQAELSSAERYDPVTERWTALPPMMIKRSSAGVAACDGKVYVVGGWSGCSGYAACEMFDPVLGHWQSIASLNLGRSQTGVCTIDGEIVAVGGCDAWNSTNTVEIYDIVENKWTYLAPMSLARRGAGVAFFKGKLYVVGGSDGQSSLVSVEIYDPELRTWSFGPSLNTPRANVGLAVMNGRLFAIGGFTGKAFLKSMEYLSEDASDWSIFLPMDLNSGLDLIGSDEGPETTDPREQCALSDFSGSSGGMDDEISLNTPLDAKEFCGIWQQNGAASSEDESDSSEQHSPLVDAMEVDSIPKDNCDCITTDDDLQNGRYLGDSPEFTIRNLRSDGITCSSEFV